MILSLPFLQLSSQHYIIHLDGRPASEKTSKLHNVSPSFLLEFGNGWFCSLNCRQNSLCLVPLALCKEESEPFHAEGESARPALEDRFWKVFSDSIHSAQLESVIIIYTFLLQNSWEMDARLLCTFTTWHPLQRHLRPRVSLNFAWEISTIYSWRRDLTRLTIRIRRVFP